jgi:competence protein ComEA
MRQNRSNHQPGLGDLVPLTRREQAAALTLAGVALVLGLVAVVSRRAPPPAPFQGGLRAGQPEARYRLNVNTADVGELQLLPGVGAGLARRIVDSRRTKGPFASVDDLERVRGIDEELVDAIRPLVCTDRPPVPRIK